MRIAPPLSAAAAVLVAAVVAVTVFTASPRVAFANVLDKLREIETATFKMVVVSKDAPMTLDCFVMRPNFMRQEAVSNGEQIINVFDFDAERMISLVPAGRFASVVDLSGLTPQGAHYNIIEEVSKISEDNAELIGEEVIDGKRLLRYDFTNGDYSGKIWVDPATSLIYRSEMTSKPINGETSTIVSDRFVWNPPLERDLFEMSIPPGYQTVTAGDRPSDAADVAAVLRLYVFDNNGVFPDEFNAYSLLGVQQVISPPGVDREQMRRRILRLARKITSDPELSLEEAGPIIQDLTGRIAPAAILLGFASDSDYRWLGSGVREGDGESVVCYWKSLDGDGYTVIRGDYSVEKGVPRPE